MANLKKTIYTLCINNYCPEITSLTFPLMEAYAKKIGADFFVISKRRFTAMPVTYEKLQVGDLARETGADWNLFFDADTLISPEMFDPTDHLSKDTVCHNGKDFAGIRWAYDNYFRRDGRHIGSCNWCAIASDWCLDLWHPLEDLSLETALENIHITIAERHSGCCQPEHLIDDYVLSRNIARYGLKATTLSEICGKLGFRRPDGTGGNPFMWHQYDISNEQKVRQMKAVLSTPNGQPAFADEGELIHDGFGNPVMRTKDGRIVGACGLGWGLR
jgi:hypothetical protein